MSNKFEKANDELILLDKEIKEHYGSIIELQNKISIKGVKKKELELIIWDNCEHKWELDNSEYDSDCKQYCIKCKLWKNRKYYI